MVSELTIIIRNEEKRCTTKHLIYDPYMVSENDKVIQDCIDAAIKDFNGEPDDVKVKITMEIK